MDFVRRWIAQIQVQLGQVSLTAKMVFGLLAFIIIGALVLVVLYSGSPHMDQLFTQPLPPAQQSEALAFIRSQRYEHEVIDGRIMVPAGQKINILAALNARQIISKDNGGGFADLLERQSWWQSNEQMRQGYNIVLQNELASAIRINRGVRNAKVIIGKDRKARFGQPARQPRASVTIETDGMGVDQQLVDAIADQVSGAVSGMTPQDVSITDATSGRSYRVRDKHDMMAGEWIEMVQAQEAMYRTKIENALNYIPTAIVEVNVELDSKRSHIQSTKYAKDTSVSLITSESRKSSTSRNETNGGVPGPEANVSAVIPGAGGTGRSEETEESDSTFAAHPGVVHEDTIDPGGQPTRVSASISIPRSFFVARYKLAQGADAKDPTDAILQPLIDEILPRIQKKVENIIAAKQPGRVVVDTYSDVLTAEAAATAAAASAGGTGTIAMLFRSGDMVKHISLGVLAAASLLMMFMMMRKATQPPKLPSAAELAGIPPALQSDDDVVGEAMEMDAALTGVELDEEAIRNRKLAEQVADMVRNNPADAAKLVGRWIHAND